MILFVIKDFCLLSVTEVRAWINNNCDGISYQDSKNLQIFTKHIDNHTYIPDFSQKIFLCTILCKRLSTPFKQEIFWIIGYFFLRGRECQQYVKKKR